MATPVLGLCRVSSFTIPEHILVNLDNFNMTMFS